MSSIYLLSNLAAERTIELTVEQDADPAAAARAHLLHTDLSDELQRGFFVSIYPIGAADDGEVDVDEFRQEDATSDNTQAPPA